MKGVSYISDEHGKPTDVVLSVKLHKSIIKDLLDLIEFATSHGQQPNPWVKKRVKFYKHLADLEKKHLEQNVAITFDQEMWDARNVKSKPIGKPPERKN